MVMPSGPRPGLTESIAHADLGLLRPWLFLHLPTGFLNSVTEATSSARSCRLDPGYRRTQSQEATLTELGTLASFCLLLHLQRQPRGNLWFFAIFLLLLKLNLTQSRIFSFYVCCTHGCRSVYRLMHYVRRPGMLGILLYRVLLYSLEAGSLTESGACQCDWSGWLVTGSQESCSLFLPRAGIISGYVVLNTEVWES